jgi:hypothetical protein
MEMGPCMPGTAIRLARRRNGAGELMVRLGVPLLDNAALRVCRTANAARLSGRAERESAAEVEAMRGVARRGPRMMGMQMAVRC